MKEVDLNGMEGGKRNFFKHWNEYREWRLALKSNDTQQDGWTHEYVDRYVLMAKVVPWLAGHLLSYSVAYNIVSTAAFAMGAALFWYKLA